MVRGEMPTGEGFQFRLNRFARNRDLGIAFRGEDELRVVRIVFLLRQDRGIEPVMNHFCRFHQAMERGRQRQKFTEPRAYAEQGEAPGQKDQRQNQPRFS